MGNRDKFFKVIKREEEGYVPFMLTLCPSLEKRFQEETGETDYQSYYNMPYRVVAAEALDRYVDFTRYFKPDQLRGNVVITKDWGLGKRMRGYYHFFEMLYPMEDFETIEDFEKYPYPDAEADYDWKGLTQKVKDIKSHDNIAVGEMDTTIFEIAWYLRGMEQFMVDMLTEPEMAEYHLDRITDMRCHMARKYMESGVDVLLLGDDVGTQRNMMMNIETWRRFFKPRLKKIINVAKECNPDILIDYHSDGNIEDIVPELIEIGVDILNPVQPECMDPVKMKTLYGDKLSFRGAIGTQTTMPFGTTEEVERVCREMIDKLGKGGGYILAPTHMLEPETPWENIETLIRVVKEFQ